LSIRIDKPIEKDKDDLLGYKEFAKNIAKTLHDFHNQKNKDGLVISIEGEWGSGKTSVINLIVNNLRSINEQKKYINALPLTYDFQPFIITSFNPWMFSTLDNIFLSFFSEISKAVEKENPFLAIENRLGNLMKEYGNLIVKYAPVTQKDNISTLLSLSDKSPSILELKEDLNNELIKLDKKILIIIDDMDRLLDKELMLMLQLVKGVADFKNVIYLLSYDKDVISASIETFKKEKGFDYLDKIVQFPVSIPQKNNATLFNYLTTKIDAFIKKEFNDDIIFQQDRWDIVSTPIMKFFENFRDVNRFLNIFFFEYYSFSKDVNLVDFISITAIKLFDPNSYNFIVTNIHLFLHSKVNYNLHGYSDYEKWKKDSSKIIEKEITEIHTKKILFELFPDVEDEDSFASFRESSKLSQKRICDENYVDIYFQLNIKGSTLSYKEYHKLESNLLSNDIDSFLTLIPTTQKVNVFRELLNERITSNESFYIDRIPLIINNLLICSSKNKKDEMGNNLFNSLDINRNLQLESLTLTKFLIKDSVDEFLNIILKNTRINITVRALFLYWLCTTKKEEKIYVLAKDKKEYFLKKMFDLVLSSNIEEIIFGSESISVFSVLKDKDIVQLKESIKEFSNKETHNILNVIDSFKSHYSSSSDGTVFYIKKKLLFFYISKEFIDKKLDNLNEKENKIIEMYKDETRHSFVDEN